MKIPILAFLVRIMILSYTELDLRGQTPVRSMGDKLMSLSRDNAKTEIIARELTEGSQYELRLILRLCKVLIRTIDSTNRGSENPFGNRINIFFRRLTEEDASNHLLEGYRRQEENVNNDHGYSLADLLLYAADPTTGATYHIRRNLKDLRRSTVLGVPNLISHLPMAEPILPGNTLIKPSISALMSSVKFPHQELEEGGGMYGNQERLSLPYPGTDARWSYTNFRRTPYSARRGTGTILGVPGLISHLPLAEPMLPGHTLMKPAVSSLYSAIKFPHTELEDGSGVYGNAAKLSLAYPGTDKRWQYTGFRRMPGRFLDFDPRLSLPVQEMFESDCMGSKKVCGPSN